jgi:small basic protein
VVEVGLLVGLVVELVEEWEVPAVVQEVVVVAEVLKAPTVMQ